MGNSGSEITIYIANKILAYICINYEYGIVVG